MSGGKKQMLLQEEAVSILENESDIMRLLDHSTATLSQLGQRERCMALINRWELLRRKLNREGKSEELIRKVFALINFADDGSFGMRFGVHGVLFLNVLAAHGTSEQLSKYEDDVRNCRMIGCFAMTELGHSSFLRGAETIARYDPKSQQFVINSPSLTSTKWQGFILFYFLFLFFIELIPLFRWIGMAGHTATHALTVAQLSVPSNPKCGLHWFLVPLRDIKTGDARY